MKTATISVLGLLEADGTCLDGISEGLPEGVDAGIVKTSIMSNCAELEILFPEPTIFKQLLTAWAKTKRLPWARYYAAITAQYSPLENYDRQETESTGENTTSATNGTSSSSGTSSTSRGVSAFNDTYTQNGEAVYQPKDHESGSVTNTVSAGTTGTGAKTGTKTSRIHGNIGVTTSQQMLQAELDITAALDVYQHITEDFKRQFCLLVY